MIPMHRVKALAPYVIGVALCLFFLYHVLELWNADLRIPFRNDGDCLYTQLWVKNLIEGGWYLHTDRAGAPYGLNLHDFPLAESLHFGIMKLLALGSINPCRIINCYFLLTFVFTTITSLFVFRYFGVPTLPALVGSLLYAFMPYHFWRGVAHLFLAAYYLIPLV